MHRAILVPLDGSPLAERALPYAQHLARASAARLLLVRAALAHHIPGTGRLQTEAEAVREAETYLRETAARLSKSGVVETAMFYGDAAEAILEEVRLRKIDLVVMATHGRSGIGRWLYGSVADEVLRHLEVPLLLIPPACQTAWPTVAPARVLVPLDGSAVAEEALGPARALAAALAAELLLVRAIDVPAADGGADVDDAALVGLSGRESTLVETVRYLEGQDSVAFRTAQQYLEDTAGELRAAGYSVSLLTAFGPPTAVISDVAQDGETAAIVMATHGRSGLARLVLGSTTDGVLRHGTQPLLVVRPTMVRGEARTPARVANVDTRSAGPGLSEAEVAERDAVL
jgi:nucleotide-binding universal stress UspA family protein